MNRKDIKKLLFYMLCEKKRLVLSFLFSILLAVLTAISPLIINRIIDNLGVKDSSNVITKMSELLFLSYALSIAISYIKSRIEQKMTFKIQDKINVDAYNALLHAKYDYIVDQPIEELYQRCTDDAQAISSLSLTTLPNFIQGIISAISSVIVLSTIYWPLVPLSIVVYALNLIPVHVFGKTQIQKGTEFRNAGMNMWKAFTDILARIRLIKIRGVEQDEIASFKEKSDTWAKYSYETGIWYHALKSFPRFLDALVPAIVFIVGGYALFSGEISVGNIIAVTLLLPNLNAPIRFYSTTVLAIRGAMVKLSQVFHLIDACKNNDEECKQGFCINEITSIEFQNVSLEIGGKRIINSMSFKVNGGLLIGITGQTGSGKSTVLLLILGLLRPTDGRILINGLDINDIDMHQFRQMACTLLQRPFLVNDTIKNNFNLLADCDWNSVENYSRLLGFDKVISHYDDNWDTVLGERGSVLSGGQKQLLAFIRAIATKPYFMFCDEMTSAMDSDLCQSVFNVLYESMGNKTTIVITHQIHLLKNANLILVIDQGNIVQTGTHDALLKVDGKYKELWSHYE